MGPFGASLSEVSELEIRVELAVQLARVTVSP